MRLHASRPGVWLALALAPLVGCDDGAADATDAALLDALPDLYLVDGSAAPTDAAARPTDADATDAAVTDGGPKPCAADAGCADAGVCDPQVPGCGEVLCTVDSECPDDAWCDGDECARGCRLEPDNCEATPAGVRRRCGDDHTCVELRPCCGADDTCSAVPEAECEGQVLRAVPTCREGGAFAGDDPCSVGGDARCATDDDCDRPFYCHPVDQRCYPGCRIGVPGTCHRWQVCTHDRACVVQPCAVNDDCPDAYYCDPDHGPSCRPGCRDDDGCSAREFCHPIDRWCASIESECDPRLCPEFTRCLQPFFGCVGLDACPNGDEDCRGDEHCDAETGMCAEGCIDDAFEGQDGFADAPPIVLSPPDGTGARRGSAQDRILCPGTRDFYAVTLAPHERMRVTIDCGRDRFGRNECAARVHGEDVPNGPRRFDHTAPPRGFDFPPLDMTLPREATYVIEVFGFGRITYAIEVETTAALCFPDDNEPNDTAEETGRPVAWNEGFLSSQSLCADDEDWFCAEPGTNGGLGLTLTTTPDSDPVSVEIYALSGARAPGGLAQPAYGGEDVSVEMTPDGTVYRFARDPDTASFSAEPWCVRVRLADGGTAAEYDVRFWLAVSDDFACEPAPNDTRDTAVDLDALPDLTVDGLLTPDVDLEVPVDGVLCPRDVDFYCFTLTAGDTAQAWVVDDGLVGDVIVQLFEPAGRPVGPEVAPTRPGEPPDRAEARDAAPGRYCVSVDGLGAAQGTYDLFVRRSPRATP